MKGSDKIALGIAMMGFISVVGYGLFLVKIEWPFNTHSLEKTGVFGDSFGALTSLFSVLAFGGVVWTVISQREELELQRIEIQNNQKEVIKQGFENTFFQMLKLHNDIVNGVTTSIRREGGLIPANGRTAFKSYKGVLEYCISCSQGDDRLDQLKNSYDLFWEAHGDQLAHYFRFLYNIFKYINDSNVENKDFYSRLVRAQLSNQELYIIFYNGLTSRGDKFVQYINEFSLMDNLPAKELQMTTDMNYMPNAGFKC